MDQGKEEFFFRRHIIELAKKAYHREQCVYTDFLNINEISIFHSMGQELPPIPYSFWGGFSTAERNKVCFHGNLEGGRQDVSGTELHHIEDYPIDCIHLYPSHIKFAEDLSHRDYLGALMNLGIERTKIGDIKINDKEAYIYMDRSISAYIMEQVEKIRHTNVKAEIIDTGDVITTQEYQEIKGSVMSVRLDSVISTAFQSSRNSITDYINKERVFVNGRLITSNSYNLVEGDIISVRGLGKFKYESKGQLTKKGRISITIQKYI